MYSYFLTLISQFYAGESQAVQAWHGIIKKIAHLISPLMEPPPIIGTHDERAKRIINITRSKKSLIDFCLSESTNLLSEKKFQLAIPGAIQALKFSQEVYGDMSFEVVEPYLILGQSSLGLSNAPQAEKVTISDLFYFLFLMCLIIFHLCCVCIV